MNEDRARVDELLEIMREHGLDALRVRVGERSYDLVLREPAPLVAAVTPNEPAPRGDAASAGPKGPSATAKAVTAPIIGVFYRSASPGVEPFVEIGDRVAVGQVLCILEAMKMMNEITSDYSGVVTRILPENGQLVSLGEEMLWIEP
jgi:acetyl-CoA carboxylase biotin carboxyl carrier protein